MATIKLRSFPVSNTLNCVFCKESITLYDPEGSEYFVCPHCHYYLQLTITDHQVVKDHAPVCKSTPLIPIGTQGTLKDLPYKVIAYMEKREGGTTYCWKEYMLYNFTKGYAFLAEYNGHWNYIAGKEHFPDLDGVSVDATYNGVSYSLYNKYAPVITGLAGEFDWNILSEKIQAAEYVAPPYMLVREHNKNEVNVNDWYLAEYIEPEEIAAAFDLQTDKFPVKDGIGGNQPSKANDRWYVVSRIAPFAMLAVLLIGLLQAWLRPERVVFSNTYPLLTAAKPDSVKSDSAKLADSINNVLAPISRNYEFQPFKTSSFKIDNSTPLEFSISSGIDNNWTEATIVLVNEQTNETWEVTKSIEYYHGFEDGESWSEGSINETILLSHIPEGKYHLNIYPFSGDRFARNLDISVTENVIVWRNVFVMLLLLGIYPFYCWYMMQRYEKKRWLSSDYSPYEKDEEEDD